MNITPIIEAVITLIAAIITAVVVPYIRSKTTVQQQEALVSLIKIVVAAAEQIYSGIGRGAEKKEYVMEWLQSHGVTVDAAKLDAMIESAVYQLKQEG
jgi:hypothetical protein